MRYDTEVLRFLTYLELQYSNSIVYLSLKNLLMMGFVPDLSHPRSLSPLVMPTKGLRTQGNKIKNRTQPSIYANWQATFPKTYQHE